MEIGKWKREMEVEVEMGRFWLSAYVEDEYGSCVVPRRKVGSN
jgi:hypothetical protein